MERHNAADHLRRAFGFPFFNNFNEPSGGLACSLALEVFVSSQHHGSRASQSDLIRRFLEQQTGSYQRNFPDGRMGATDDGELTYALATDQKRGVIVIKFAHPTDWIGLDIAAATELRDQLTERIMALRGITA